MGFISPLKEALLLSGGMESAALAFWKRPSCAITIDYGQLAAEAEITASAILCKSMAIHHIVVRTDCSSVGLGCMTKSSDQPAFSPTEEWWPFRNQLLITLAASKGVSLGITKLIIGTVKNDNRHCDGTAQFVHKMSKLLELQEGRISLSAPGLKFSDIELIKQSKIPYDLLAWTHSCHVSNFACGVCPGCIKNSEVWLSLSQLKNYSKDNTNGNK